MDLLMVMVAGGSALIGSFGMSVAIAKWRKQDWRKALVGPRLGAVVGVTAMAAVMSARSPRHADGLDTYRRQMESDPAYIALRKTDPNANATLQKLAQEGMYRLTPSETRDAASVMLRAATSSADACSGMWPFNADTAAVAKGTRALPRPELDAVIKVSMVATLHGLHHDGQLRTKVTDVGAQNVLFQAATDALPGEDGSRLRTLVRDGAKTKADACDGTKLLFRAVQTLPDEPSGQLFALMM